VGLGGVIGGLPREVSWLGFGLWRGELCWYFFCGLVFTSDCLNGARVWLIAGGGW